ncbi:glycosyltransferase 87 family protein [Terriglobus aquaticus]|uniref:Glycosyltransferase 87 family protein n=1 Tax=Terriglobus aquaticus TaxID=940139 RepID=A0ABW9KPQ2_9BACT|nr:glycosyltransferase 87 family protein [Terriglobus aquaticus]
MIAAKPPAPSSRDPLRPHSLWADLLLCCATLAGLVSCAAGVVHAISRSQDFQWSGERLLLHHIDPWRDYLLGDPVHGLLATQVPNYLPILYLLLIPFGLLSAKAAYLGWALCNSVFAVASALLAARFYGLRSWRTSLGISAAVLAAAPTRVTMGNGQQGLLILLLWSLALLRPAAISPRRAALAGVSYLKYSFAPALALYMLLRDGISRGVRTILWSLVPCAAATVLIWLWITGGHDLSHLFALITEPLAVTRVGYQPTGDPGQTFMDLFEFLLGGGPVATPRLTTVSLLVALAITLAVLVPAMHRRFPNDTSGETERTGWLVALTATMSFVLYKHHPYDEVVFLFPFCYALRHRRRPAAIAALFFIGYCWYVQPHVDLHIRFSLAWCAARMSILFALILCVYRIAETSPDLSKPAGVTV